MASEDPIIDAHNGEDEPLAGAYGPMTMDASPSLSRVAPALVALQASIEGLDRDGINPQFRSRYISYDALRDALRPLLEAQGLAWIPAPIEADGPRVRLRNIVLHSSGEFLAWTMTMPVDTSNPERGANILQRFGIALSYASRYVARALGVYGLDDTDGETQQPIREAKPAPARAPAQAGAQTVTSPTGPEDVDAAKKAFFAACVQAGVDPKDRDARDALILEVLGEAKWFTRLSAAEIGRLTASLRGERGLLTGTPDPDDPFDELAPLPERE